MGGRVSHTRAYVRPMADAARLLNMLGDLAHWAGDDPDACVALASMVRATAAQSRATEVLQGRQEDVLLRRGQVGIGEDRRLDPGHVGGIQGQPPQVA